VSDNKIKVFAYGSNLSRKRLELRVGPVEVIGPGELLAHELRFHKIGRDGSAKADAFATGRAADIVWGVIYALSHDAKRKLDRFEGLGRDYLEREVRIRTAGGETSATVYHAHPDRIGEGGLPFDWYVDWVLQGAREHGLQPAYIERVASHPTIADCDTDRTRRERSAQGFFGSSGTG
jgi:gamma-glutamylcyclotransferase